MALQVQTLRCSFCAEQFREVASTYAAFKYIAVASLKPTIAPISRTVTVTSDKVALLKGLAL